jgi:O-antigen/teichoic acid export membrane protein
MSQDEVTERAQSLGRRARRGTIISVGGQGAAQVLRLAGNLALARLLFAEAFGLMAIVYLVVFALEQISNIGIGAAVLRYERGDHPEFLDTAWTMQVIRGVALWGIACALTPFVSTFYGMPELDQILPVAAFAQVIVGFTSTKFMVLQRRIDVARQVSIELGAQVCTLVVMVSTAWLTRSIWALVVGGLANALATTVLSHVAIPGPRNRFAWHKEDARSIFSIGKWVVASSGVSFLLAQIDIALLGRLVPAGMLGVYSMGSMIPSLLRDLSFRLSTSVLSPVLAETNRDDRAELWNRYAAARRITLPTALFAALGAACVAPTFFEVLYDERYAAAGWIAQLTLLRFWFAYLQVSGCLTLLSIGHGRTWAVSNVVGLICSTIGCLVGFHVAELPGLVIGMAIGTAFGAAVPLFELRRLGIGSPWPEIGYSALGLFLAAVMFAAMKLSAPLIPIPDAALRGLVASGIAVAPFALWALLRVLPEVRRS